MIIYGWATKQLTGPALTGKCSACGSQELGGVTQIKYAHIYWIPIFPFRKNQFVYCSHCKGLEPLKSAVKSGNVAAQQFPKPKTPLYMFSGLALGLLIMVGGVYLSEQESEKRAAMVLRIKSAPQPNDILVSELEKPVVIDKKTYTHGVFKISSFDNDEFKVHQLNIVYPSLSSARKAASKGELYDPSLESKEAIIVDKTRFLDFWNDLHIVEGMR